jgi:hypothetical protein
MTQWDWMIEQREKGDNRHIDVLKEEWCEKNGYEKKLVYDCFFCEYSRQHGADPRSYSTTIGLDCNCPAKKIDEEFRCTEGEYHYARNPLAFYKKLKQLNRIRLKGS